MPGRVLSSTVRPTSWTSAAASTSSAAKPRVELGGLAAERRYSDRVLEQPAGIGMVVFGRGRRCRKVASAPARTHRRSQALVRHLADQVVEEPWISSVSRRIRRGQAHRVDVGRLERADVELQPVAELLDAPENAHRVAFDESSVEQLDVIRDARLDPAGPVDEPERKVRAPPSCASFRSALTAKTPSTTRSATRSADHSASLLVESGSLSAVPALVAVSRSPLRRGGGRRTREHWSLRPTT